MVKYTEVILKNNFTCNANFARGGAVEILNGCLAVEIATQHPARFLAELAHIEQA